MIGEHRETMLYVCVGVGNGGGLWKAEGHTERISSPTLLPSHPSSYMSTHGAMGCASDVVGFHRTVL